MDNPFPLTTGCLKFVGGGLNDARKSGQYGHGLFTLFLGYGILPAAFIVDFCLVMPVTIILALLGENERR